LPAAATALLAAFERQAAWCQPGAPFSARVLRRGKAWLERDAQALGELAAVSDDPLTAAVALRWLGGLHHLALLGEPPWASLWPPAAPAQQALDDALDKAIIRAWQEQRPHMQAALALPPQTNEVQRSAALLPGLLHVAVRTGLPMVLLELGASAGLNLWCDHYRHEHTLAQGRWCWGDTSSSLTLSSEWVGAAPAVAPLSITRRAGCDALPIDLRRAGEGLRLASFIWPDQAERLARLRIAQQVAAACMARTGVAVQAMGGADFLRRELRERVPGQATVLMHSVVWQYIAAQEQADISAQMHAAGQQADAGRPLAWLRFEPPSPDLRVELRCRIWPSGADELLAICHPHAARIEWLAA
jgi:hypothetical protein